MQRSAVISAPKKTTDISISCMRAQKYTHARALLISYKYKRKGTRKQMHKSAHINSHLHTETSFPRVQPAEACWHSEQSHGTNNLSCVVFFSSFLFLRNRDCWNRWNINTRQMHSVSAGTQTRTHRRAHTQSTPVKNSRDSKKRKKKRKNTHISRRDKRLSRETFCGCINI